MISSRVAVDSSSSGSSGVPVSAWYIFMLFDSRPIESLSGKSLASASEILTIKVSINFDSTDCNLVGFPPLDEEPGRVGVVILFDADIELVSLYHRLRYWLLTAHPLRAKI